MGCPVAACPQPVCSCLSAAAAARGQPAGVRPPPHRQCLPFVLAQCINAPAPESGSDCARFGALRPQACFRHDVCLEEKSHLAASTECTFGGTPNCDCDRVLYNDAWDVSTGLSVRRGLHRLRVQWRCIGGPVGIAGLWDRAACNGAAPTCRRPCWLRSQSWRCPARP